MTDDNVTPIRPGTKMQDVDPDWLGTANRLTDDVEADTRTPAALDESIARHPAGQTYDPVADKVTTDENLGRTLAAMVLGESTSGIDQAADRGRVFFAGSPTGTGDLITPEAEWIETVDEPTTPKSRVLSAAERKAQEAEARRIERELQRQEAEHERLLKAEAKRFREIDPLRRVPFYTNLVIGILIFLTSGLFSYAAIAAAAEWMRPEWPWLTLLVPGFVELFIIFFGIEGIINQAKAVYARTATERLYYEKQYKTSTNWMIVFAAVAVLGNVAHTLERWLETGEIPWYGFVGIVMAGLAPLSVVLITKRMSRLLFIYAVEE